MKQTKTTAQAKGGKPAPKAAPVNMGTLFDRENLIWMGAGLVVMAIGFFLMAGGKSPDPNVFNADEVYGKRRITVAPIVILAGLVILIVAIFRKPKTR